MADASQTFTEMFRKIGEQLKVPSFDATRIMEQHQKNIDKRSDIDVGERSLGSALWIGKCHRGDLGISADKK